MLYTTQRESSDHAACVPKAVVFTVPEATFATRSSLFPFDRLMPYASHFPSGDRPPLDGPPRPPPPPTSTSVSHWPYSAGVGGSFGCAARFRPSASEAQKSAVRV